MKEEEEWPRATVILSGSTLKRLFRPQTRCPVGRVRRLVLGPFSFSEFLLAVDKRHLAAEVLGGNTRISNQRHRHLLAQFDQFLAVGGLPAVVHAYATGQDYALVRREIIARKGRVLTPVTPTCPSGTCSTPGCCASCASRPYRR